MPERPTGTITFLFTDIEGSTRLLRDLGAEQYRNLLEDHRKLLRAVFDRHGGYEVDSQGDAFFVAFDRPRAAVGAAADLQRDLAGHLWPEGRELRVRVGIHTCEATATAEGYVGIGIHRGARICSAGHGGQVLVSLATRDLLEEDEPALAFVDLGEHRLKDVPGPQRVFQLVLSELPDRFPPLRTLENRPTNLPVQATSLVGRAREVREIVDLLRRPDVRAVTLTGPGGTGKTRLAIQAAGELVGDFTDGVFFVALAVVTDPELVLPAIAKTVGVDERAGQSLLAYLARKQLLLVLDSLEQVVPAAPLLAQILSEAPGVNLLATSREATQMAAERVYPVSPLRVPDPRHLPDPRALSQYEAPALFVDRARAVQPSFEVTTENALAIAEICVRLDGLPLALELAAARIGLLSPDGMLKRLDQRLTLLTSRRQDVPERQQTLRATLAWSYDLLDEEERTLFARLGVFAGGSTLAAAEAVCDAELDTIGSLIDKSLIRRDGERFAMLETIREYAFERLAASGQEADLRDRHAAFFEHLAERSYAERFDREHELAEELELEHQNLRAALDRLSEIDAGRRLRLAGALGWFWHEHSHLSEGRSRLKEALEASTERNEDRARALGAFGTLAAWQGDVGVARPLIDEAVSIWRELGRDQEVSLALHQLGWGYFFAGDNESARGFMETSLELQRSLGPPALVNRAQLGLLQILVAVGDVETVRRVSLEALELARQLGDLPAEGFAHHFLADCALLEEDFVGAEEGYRRSLTAARRTGDEIDICSQLQGIGMSAAGRGNALFALRIVGAANAHLQALGVHLIPGTFWTALVDRYLSLARDELGAGAAAAWEAGQGLTLERAMDEALTPEPSE
jgi:predicted ATPase/class 3 adenylate cyclase